MNKFAEGWAAQLRAGALQIAEDAEKIVGDLELNKSMDVVIHLSSGDGSARVPSIEIRREIASRPMIDVVLRKNQIRRDREWGMMMDTMMRQAREREEGKQDETN